MKNILYALAIRNPNLVYCQGLNFIAYFIIKNITDNEDEAFWILVHIMECLLPIDFYTNIKNIHAFVQILDEYLKIQQKDVWKKIIKFG